MRAFHFKARRLAIQVTWGILAVRNRPGGLGQPYFCYTQFDGVASYFFYPIFSSIYLFLLSSSEDILYI